MAGRRRGAAVTAVLAAMATACGGAVAAPASGHARGDDTPTTTAGGPSTTAATGELGGPVDIGGGRSLHLHCTGRGEPTVILESGYHDSSDLWSVSEPTPPAVGPSVQERLSRHTRVCSYDRPGTLVRSGPEGDQVAVTERSTAVPMPRPASAAVADLHALIAAAGLPTPVVLVAHSMGGLLARLHAATHPEEVAGVVFVDAFPAELREAMGALWADYVDLLAHPGTPLDDEPAFEVFDVDASIDEVLAAGPLPDIPLAVISKTEPFPLPPTDPMSVALEQAWVDTSADLVTLGEGTPHVLATGSDHYVQVRQPDLVAATALLVVERARG